MSLFDQYLVHEFKNNRVENSRTDLFFPFKKTLSLLYIVYVEFRTSLHAVDFFQKKVSRHVPVLMHPGIGGRHRVRATDFRNVANILVWEIWKANILYIYVYTGLSTL